MTIILLGEFKRTLPEAICSILVSPENPGTRRAPCANMKFGTASIFCRLDSRRSRGTARRRGSPPDARPAGRTRTALRNLRQPAGLPRRNHRGARRARGVSSHRSSPARVCRPCRLPFAPASSNSTASNGSSKRPPNSAWTASFPWRPRAPKKASSTPRANAASAGRASPAKAASSRAACAFPRFLPAVRFERCLEQAADHRYFLDEALAPPLLREIPAERSDSVALLIGPEGGWTDAERQLATPPRGSRSRSDLWCFVRKQPLAPPWQWW